MQILFWIRKAKTNKRGEAPIYCRITLGGIRAQDFSTGIFMPPLDWKAKRQTCKNEVLAARLRHIRDQLDYIFLELDKSGRNPTAHLVKSVFQQSEQILTMTDLCKKYEVFIAQKADKGLARPRTLKRYHNFTRVMTRYTGVCGDVFLAAHDFGFKQARGFLKYCTEKLHHGPEHANRMVKNAKNILQWGLQEGLIKDNPLFQWKGQSGPVKEIVYLESREMESLAQTRFERESLQRAADLFLFQCYTGLDYGDTQTFIPAEHIRKDPSGRFWIVKAREKNGNQAALPLFPEAIGILEKYQGQDLLGHVCRLPRFSNQKYNERLKEVAQEMGFTKRITSHVGRKTFGTVCLNKGFSIVAVSKMLGHRFVRTTERHYARVLQQRVMMEWDLLNGPAVNQHKAWPINLGAHAE